MRASTALHFDSDTHEKGVRTQVRGSHPGGGNAGAMPAVAGLAEMMGLAWGANPKCELRENLTANQGE
jgi:hypothetical protein